MARDGIPMLMLIDDEPAQRRLVSALAARAGWRTIFAGDGETAIATLGTQDGMQLDAIILDQWSPDYEPAGLIREIRERRPALPILILTAHNNVAVAVEAMRAGATDYLSKPIAPERLLAALNATISEGASHGELRPLTEKITAPLSFEDVVGSAPQFRAALAIAAKAARARVPVLIEGESGVGKDVIARAIHAASPRHKQAMVTVNCGAIPANLVESELFGHERGAFTGAFDRHVGKFASADTGTIFLDEVSEMPLDAQVKLLRVLQDGEMQPIGARRPIHVDVRVIAATNKRLIEEIEAGRFREDLYYRLNVVQLTIPPLPARWPANRPLKRRSRAITSIWNAAFRSASLKAGRKMRRAAPPTAQSMKIRVRARTCAYSGKRMTMTKRSSRSSKRSAAGPKASMAIISAKMNIAAPPMTAKAIMSRSACSSSPTVRS